jgi:Tol biopolymer transport system component/DNA-binding winged helix-turn-helix (wHTH) protein
MSTTPQPVSRNRAVYRFGEFEADASAWKLRRNGTPVDLQQLPFQVLFVLLESAGELVTREQLRGKLWPGDVFVDFDDGLSTAVRKLRLVLEDSASEPRFIETVPRRGYRFIYPVTRVARHIGKPVRRQWAYAVAGTGLVILTLTPVLYQRFDAFNGQRSTRVEQITKFTDSVRWPAASADGRLVAFMRGQETFGGVNAGELYLKILPGGEPTPVTNVAQGHSRPAFSPDGSRLAFTVVDKNFSWDTWLMTLPAGEPKRWLTNASGLTWVDEQHILFSEIKSGIHMAIVTSNLERTEARDVYVPASQSGMAHNAYLSPDRRSVLVVEMDVGRWLPCRLVPFDGSSSGRPVGPRNSQCTAAGWGPDGTWMYFIADAGDGYHVWRQRFPDGEPQQLTFGPMEESGLAMAADGRSLITASGLAQSVIWLNDGVTEKPISHEGNAFLPSFSTDGKKLYYLVRGTGARAFVHGELWVCDLATRKREVVLPGFQMTHYSLSRDGTQVAFTTIDKEGRGSLWLAPLDGTSAPRQLSAADESRVFFTPENDLIFLGTEGAAKYVFRMRPDGSERRKFLADPVMHLISVSPDAEFAVIWVSTPGEKTSAAIKAFPSGGGTPLMICDTCAGGVGTVTDVVSWSPDQKFFVVSFQSFPGMRTRAESFMVPLAPGMTLPRLPRTGIASDEDLTSQPGVRVIHESRVFGGPNGSYAMVRVSALRNLYRVWLR